MRACVALREKYPFYPAARFVSGDSDWVRRLKKIKIFTSNKFIQAVAYALRKRDFISKDGAYIDQLLSAIMQLNVVVAMNLARRFMAEQYDDIVRTGVAVIDAVRKTIQERNSGKFESYFIAFAAIALWLINIFGDLSFVICCCVVRMFVFGVRVCVVRRCTRCEQ